MLGALLLMGGVLLAEADATAGDDLRLQVRRLVRKLDARELAEREAAEKELIELGPEILDLLPQPSERTSAEVEQRVSRIRQALERCMAESAAEASTVTLRGELPLSEILAAVEQQTGNKIAFERIGRDKLDSKLEVDFENTPFWQALDRVLDQATLGVYAYGGEKSVRLVPWHGTERSRAGRASYSGPFRFEAVAIRAERDLRNPENRSLRLDLEVSWEPRLAPVTLQQKMVDVEAFDEDGNPLGVDARQAVLEVPVIRDATTVPLQIPLELPPRDVERIARLEGTLTALVPGKVETFRFKDLEGAKNVDQRIAGVTVVLELVRKNKAIWEVRVRVRFDEAKDALASHRNWIYDNEVCLEDSQGKSIAWATFETTGQTENEVGVAYYFSVEGPLADYTLVYKTATVILSTEIDYEIRDVELP